MSKLLVFVFFSCILPIVSSFNSIKAAVLIPGFLTGADEFEPLCQELMKRGIPTVAVPFPNWHWIPCLGGRSARPILERVDFTVKHLIANNGDVTKIPPYEYNLLDLWEDFQSNPGGVAKVGGTDRVKDYPVVQPRGTFVLPDDSQLPSGAKVALIGHSAGGWIGRAYLSDCDYGGRVYNGQELIHSLVTLGTPHGDAPGPAFEGIKWCNEEATTPIRSLAVGGTGFMGGEWGALTQGSYAFCCPDGTDGTSYTGDGVTPIQSALAMEGAETMIIDGCTHFCWSDVFGGDIVAPELTKDHRAGRSWYGSDTVINQWAKWLEEGTDSK
jgi:hypothetical protein